MAKFDPAYANSSGYFKDPVTGDDLSVDTPRVIPCSFENGKFTWPCVASSDGSQILKIVYKYFTDEEKELYKAYRGRPSSGEPSIRVHKPKQPKTESVSAEPAPQKPVDYQVVKYDEEGAVSASTQEIISDCDTCLGISFISGIPYALLTKGNSGIVHHVPRSCIPDTTFDRLCSYAKRY